MRLATPRCTISLFALALLVFPSTHRAAAQSAPVDEGMFEVSFDGEAAGSEEFSIRRAGTGSEAQTIATAEVTLDVPEGRLDLRPALQAAGGEMAVAAYQIKISGHVQEEITLTLGDGRFLTRVRSERGERERELRAPPGTILLDANVAHQYYFVTNRFPTGGGTVPVIVPRQGEQFEMRVTDLGQDPITVAGSSVQARHLRLEGAGSTTEVWADDQGRILRVERPDSGYSAVRSALP